MTASVFHKIKLEAIRQFFPTMLLILGIVACDTRNGVDREAVKNEMANRELKRLRISDILQGAQKLSSDYFALTVSAEKSIWKDSLSMEENVLLLNEAREEVQALAEAFQYAVEQSLPLEDHVEESGEYVLVYHPVVRSDSLTVIQLTIPKKTIVKLL